MELSKGQLPPDPARLLLGAGSISAMALSTPT